MSLREMVKDVRKRMGLTQCQLAEKLGTTQTAVSRMENCGAQAEDMARRIFLLIELRDELDGVRRIQGVSIKREGEKVIQIDRSCDHPTVIIRGSLERE